MKSKASIFLFKPWDLSDINKRFVKRNLERKLGEDICTIDKAKYLIMGISESIGPRANLGKSGAETGFDAFCEKFLSMQSTETFNAKDVAFVGQINVNKKSTISLTDQVSELDVFVNQIINKYVLKNQVLIVIGGGHNNAFPIIQSMVEKYSNSLNIINLDAHSDYRPLDGRHSGNPFSYAYKNGWIKKYTVLGLHQRYNSQKTLDSMSNDNHSFTFLEDYIDQKRDLISDINQVYDTLSKEDDPIGIELDLDVIPNMPSSAMSPSGVDFSIARAFIRKLAGINQVRYLHLPEGAPINEQQNNQVGKALAYLVTDFLSVHGKLKL